MPHKDPVARAEYHVRYRDKNRQALYAKVKKYYRDNPGKATAIRRRSKLRYAYGLTQEKFEELLCLQGGACAICKTTAPGGRGAVGPSKGWCVDHDHQTGAVRGILCSPCNSGIGHLRDSPELLDAAAAYLRSPSVKHVALRSENRGPLLGRPVGREGIQRT